MCHLKTSLWCYKLQPLERTTALVALNVARKGLQYVAGTSLLLFPLLLKIPD